MTEGSFSWKVFLRKTDIAAASVSSFNHVALARSWENIISTGTVAEVKSPDCTTCCESTPCCYWIATIIRVSGYMGLMRYEGFDSDESMDIWINLSSYPHIHPIGWCAENGMPLQPPKCIEDKHADWKEYVMRRIQRVRTIPSDFAFKVEEHKHSVIKKGAKLEAVDRSLPSAMRVATVIQVTGGRLQLRYEDSDNDDEEFWCHERSPCVHPIGWAQLIGHPLKTKPDYALTSLSKMLCRMYEPNDATWDMFLQIPNFVRSIQFQTGMKLETIDPTNLSNMCVATVAEVLRNSYLMIEIDGTDPAVSYCCHASSPYIFPIGFSQSNCIKLTPPKAYKEEFDWAEYMKKTNSRPAPSALFYKEIPNHGLREGMYLEAVDLMEPKLICVATICKVIGRLLRIHFEGWEDTFDQWCDCESPDLYPIGWCQAVGYKLEPPRIEESCDSKESKKALKSGVNKTRKRKKRTLISRKKSLNDPSDLDKVESEDSDYNPGKVKISVEDSNSE